MCDPMQAVFKALADTHRRQLLDRLCVQDGQTLNELCEEMAMSRQAVTKHLSLLEQANLVVSVQRGRFKHHYLNAVPLQEIVDRWVDKYRQREADALLTLKQQVEVSND
ncbi:MAG: metalloregulator ArsR/SmtB family transcription factor [Gammaproteobacteria bacterium]|nr:metalloregulator ArsR/SmtB family transcription factor [Gammaproteobacteria bacterium]